jgi:hypothetical protein
VEDNNPEKAKYLKRKNEIRTVRLKNKNITALVGSAEVMNHLLKSGGEVDPEDEEGMRILEELENEEDDAKERPSKIKTIDDIRKARQELPDDEESEVIEKAKKDAELNSDDLKNISENLYRGKK